MSLKNRFMDMGILVPVSRLSTEGSKDNLPNVTCGLRYNTSYYGGDIGDLIDFGLDPLMHPNFTDYTNAWLILLHDDIEDTVKVIYPDGTDKKPNSKYLSAIQKDFIELMGVYKEFYNSNEKTGEYPVRDEVIRSAFVLNKKDWVNEYGRMDHVNKTLDALNKNEKYFLRDFARDWNKNMEKLYDYLHKVCKVVK